MHEKLPEPIIKVVIAGNPLHSFKSLRLEQSINAHHRFEMFLDYEVGEAAQAYTLDKTTEWLGKLTGIIFGERTFRGIITQVSLYKETGGTFLKVSGYSYTYLLETEPHFASWNKTTLKDIVSELTSQANVAAKIKPERTTPLEYECQYGESSFRFLQRLAQQHYEWFYFDGEELIFGKPMLPQAVTLVYQSGYRPQLRHPLASRIARIIIRSLAQRAPTPPKALAPWAIKLLSNRSRSLVAREISTLTSGLVVTMNYSSTLRKSNRPMPPTHIVS